MKAALIFRQLPFFTVFLTLLSCSPTRNNTNAAAGRDGSTIEKAIVVKSVADEYKWIKEKYPGSKVTQQGLIRSGNKRYDVLTFTTQSGEVKQAYFDITSFFGKY